MKLIYSKKDEENKAISTISRTTSGHGLFHILDTGCLVLGKTYNIYGKLRITSNDGTKPSCNPNSILHTDGCPRASIRAFEHGQRTSQQLNIAHAVVPFSAGEWNVLHGTFTVDHALDAADKVLFFVDGVREGVQIGLDDIKIVPDTESEGLNCIRNGDFEVGDSRNCKCFIDFYVISDFNLFGI